MPKARSPERDRAFEIYRDHSGEITNRRVAEMLSAEFGKEINEKTVGGWKSKGKDNWDVHLQRGSHPADPSIGVLRKTDDRSTPKNDQPRARGEPGRKGGGAPRGNQNAKGHGAPRGNQNAAGNAGGGAPPGNKNALTHGRFETIIWDALDEDERELLGVISTDPIAQLDQQILDLNIRKRRMFLRIQALKNGLTEKGRRVLMERQKIKEVVTVHEEKSGQSKQVPVERFDMVETEIEETEYRKIDDICKWETELTAVEKALTGAIREKAKLLLDGQKLEIQKAKVFGIPKAEEQAASKIDLSQLSDEELIELERLAGKFAK